MENIAWPFRVGIVVAVVYTILRYWMKFVNREKGYPFHLIDHSRDVDNFKKVVQGEKDPDARRRYALILRASRVAVYIMIASFLATGFVVLYQRP